MFQEGRVIISAVSRPGAKSLMELWAKVISGRGFFFLGGGGVFRFELGRFSESSTSHARSYCRCQNVCNISRLKILAVVDTS